MMIITDKDGRQRRTYAPYGHQMGTAEPFIMCWVCHLRQRRNCAAVEGYIANYSCKRAYDAPGDSLCRICGEYAYSPRIHELKTEPKYFDAILHYGKNFEIRKNDRDFRAGDFLHLRECTIKQIKGNTWPFLKRINFEAFSNREILTKVNYMTDFPSGLRGGYVCLALDTVMHGRSWDKGRRDFTPWGEI